MFKVITIAGFDQSAGAGLLLDIKVFNHFKTHGFGVVSAITIQNEVEIEEVLWINKSTLEKQLNIIFKRHKIDAAKIGVIENLETLDFVISSLKNNNALITIIWDPILTSSSGFAFQTKINRQEVERIATKCTLITPNKNEFDCIWGKDTPVTDLPNQINILYKSSTVANDFVMDQLYVEGKLNEFKINRLYRFDKHGTGCLLSSSITACLAKGNSIMQSYKLASIYLNKYMLSTKTSLGVTF